MEPRFSCSASHELNHYTTAAPTKLKGNVMSVKCELPLGELSASILFLNESGTD